MVLTSVYNCITDAGVACWCIHVGVGKKCSKYRTLRVHLLIISTRDVLKTFPVY